MDLASLANQSVSYEIPTDDAKLLIQFLTMSFMYPTNIHNQYKSLKEPSGDAFDGKIRY